MASKKRIVVQALLGIIIIIGGLFGFKVLQGIKPELERRLPEPVYPMVRTVTLSIGTIDLVINGEGTVRPVTEIQVVPRVGGTVVQTSPGLVNGGTFSKGDLLIAIDNADYKIAYTLAQAGVKEAESQFELARQDAEAARSEWVQLNPDSSPPPLVAKQPQLDAVEAHLQAKRANLEKASLDLERTKIIAPFHGKAGSENISPGQFVTPGQPIGTLYATDAVEVVVPLESSALAWFDVPGFNTDTPTGAEAEISANVAGSDKTWPGRLVRAQGRIDPKTRMINVVIRVEAPYSTLPPLHVGQFARVRIKGESIPDAAVIPRAAVREDNTVWVLDEEDRLNFREVEIIWKDRQGMVVRKGLHHGERVVISTLKSVSDGMKVRPVDTGSLS